MSEAYRGYYDITEDIIARLKNAGCAVVTFGDTPDYMKGQKNVVTPGGHVSPVGFSSDQVDTVQLEILVYDLTTFEKLDRKQSKDPKYGERNTVDNLDTTKSIIDQFIKKIQRRTIGLNNGGYYRVTTSPQWTAFYEDGNVRVSGWVGTINIDMMTYASSCDVTDTSVVIPGETGAPFVRIDGSTPFIAPQSGIDPTAPEHLATKNYVDSLVTDGDSIFIIRGGVFYTGTDLDFDIDVVVSFFGVEVAVIDTVTLDAGDSLPRRDTIWIDQDGNSGVIKGTPDANPFPPAVEEGQFALTDVLVNAFATTPEITLARIYRDGFETGYTGTAYAQPSGAPQFGSIDFTSTIDPCQGSQSIRVATSKTTGIRIQFGSTLDISGFDRFALFVRFPNGVAPNKTLLMSVWEGSGSVGSPINFHTFGLSRVSTDCQLIEVPTSLFPTQNIDRLQIRLDGGSTSQIDEYFIDDIFFTTGAAASIPLDVITVQNDGANVGTRPKINFINALSIVDNPSEDRVDVTLPAGGGGGDVDSVNGQTGDVVLDAEDVGAYPDSNPGAFVNAAGAAAAAPVQSVTGTAVSGTSSDPVINLPSVFETQVVLTPVSGDLDYDFEDGQSFRTSIASNTELQFPTFEAGAIPTNVTISYQITVSFTATADFTFVAGYFDGDTAAATISGIDGEVYIIYFFLQQFNSKIDVNAIKQT